MVASSTDYTVGSASTATVTVNDDDDPPITTPVVSITGGRGITEGGTASFTLTATLAPQGDFAITGQTGTKMVTIGATGTATLTVATADDNTDEADSSITATIQTGHGYTVATSPDNGASVTVADNDEPVVSIAGGSGITEGGVATFTLTATPALQSDITVQVDVADSGNFATTGQTGTKMVTIGATGTATLTVTTADDNTDEADGSITVTIQIGNGYTVATSPDNGASVTVADNDAAPGVPMVSISDAQAHEDDRLMIFTVSLSPAAKQTVYA